MLNGILLGCPRGTNNPTLCNLIFAYIYIYSVYIYIFRYNQGLLWPDRTWRQVSK